MLVTLWVFSSHATQWRGHQVQDQMQNHENHEWHQNRHARSDAPKLLHQHQMTNGGKLTDASRKQSISQNQLKDCPLMKQDILHVYSDVFTGIGKFPGAAI